MSSQTQSPTKKTAVQTTINGYFTSTPPEVRKDKGHRKDRNSRNFKRKRSTPTRSTSPDEPGQIYEIANLEEPDTISEGKSRKIKPFKLRLRRRIPSSSSEFEIDIESEAVKQIKDSPEKSEKGVKRNGKLKSPKSTSDARKNGIHNLTSDIRKPKTKMSTPTDNARTILSYFGKISTTSPASCPLIVVGEVSSSVISDSDEDIMEVKTPSRHGRRLFETDTLYISPTKSELSVSSFEFEKEERLVTLESSIQTTNACENDEESIEPDCGSDLSVHVISDQDEEKEDEDENVKNTTRSIRKRPRLTSPKTNKMSRKSGRVSRNKHNSDPSSPPTSTSKNSDGSASGTPTSSQTPVDTGRRRSSRIQKIQMEILDQDCKDDLTPSPAPVTDRKKRRKKFESSSASSEDDIHQDQDPSASSDSEGDEYFVKKPKKKLASIFLSKKEREKELQRLKEEKEPKKVLTQEQLDFLRSGVPDEITKAQKSIEKKKLDLELEDPLQFFPTFSHNVEPREFYEIDWTKSAFPLRTSGVEEIVHKQGLSKCTAETERLNFAKSDLFCCGSEVGTGTLSRKFLHILTKKPKTCSESDQLPWVDKYRVGRRNDLVIDKAALHKFEKWLRQWRSDIKDDGGTSRKIVEKKKKKRESDSDFVTDEEAEDEFLKKSVVLVGPTGCGKTAMVYVLAKQIGFKVVEVSFSSRRSGKDVLQSVEEATLSRRISDKAEVDDKHCLLLFKDIDQLHVEDDEGFHAAVAQLITASCRPIVMTICSTSFCVIDPKIHKKDPLWIYFQPPPPTAIVNKLLLPIVEAELERLDRNFDLDSYTKDKQSVVNLLNSLVRHSDSDIRKSLNQMQVLWSTKNSFNFKTLHHTLSPSLDLDFIQSPAGQKDKEAVDKDKSSEDLPKSKTKSERLIEIEEMEQLARNLEHITEFERCRSTLDQIADDTEPIPVSHRILPYFDIRFHSSLFEIHAHQNQSLLDISRSLTFQTDESTANCTRSTELYDELTSYVDHVNNYDAIAFVRTIVKQSVLSSVGSEAKRNGRIKPYFNCLGRDFIDRICNNLGFPEEVEVMKQNCGLDQRSARRQFFE